MDIADVTIHVDETIGHDQRVGIVDNLMARDGVNEVTSSDEKPHLMVVKYNPANVSSKEVLQVVLDAGVHAELIGF